MSCLLESYRKMECLHCIKEIFYEVWPNVFFLWDMFLWIKPLCRKYSYGISILHKSYESKEERLPLFGHYGYVETRAYLTIKILLSCRLSTVAQTLLHWWSSLQYVENRDLFMEVPTWLKDGVTDIFTQHGWQHDLWIVHPCALALS
jgi:hypothetical protein